jgi:trans-aconitate methyltransferase
MPWDPNQYHKFQEQRSAPFYDLLALVEVRPDLRVVDLGCGTGELTRQLADSLPGSVVTGLDSSPQMLEKAASFSGPGLNFIQGDQSYLPNLTTSKDIVQTFLLYHNPHKTLWNTKDTFNPPKLSVVKSSNQNLHDH